MALYLGNSGHKINLDGEIYNLNLYTKTVITNENLLLTSDDVSISKTSNN